MLHCYYVVIVTIFLLQVFKAHGPLMQDEILPLLIVLTNEALYVLSLEGDNFACHFALLYKELQAILVSLTFKKNMKFLNIICLTTH